MAKGKVLKKLKLSNVLILLSVIFISCTLLIFINYYTIKILSANRAYVNGESHYSKGQKDAVRYLITYLYTEDASQWELFKKELSVPLGDGKARIGLIGNTDDETIKKALIEGRNHEKDLNDMIWLYRNFNQISFFKKAINEWEKGDALINQFNTIGNKIHNKIQKTHLDDASKKEFLAQISNISDKLTVNERNFSFTLGEGTREIKGYLIYTNIFFILIIICSVSIYYGVMVKKLMQSKHEIETTNSDLIHVNKELDRFVYSASHDLRSPINSLKGLVHLLKTEDNPEETKKYLSLMDQVLSKQDQFISDIIDYSRNKRTKENFEPVSLVEIINDSISQHQYIETVKRITIDKQLMADNVLSDRLRLKIIINNLLSNAIKYADLEKEKPFILIKTYLSKEDCIIEIKDNGIGIDEKSVDKIFDMFFVTDHNKGTGLGLYIVKEAADNIHGTISVESTPNVGSKFIVSFPHHNEA